MTFSSHVTRLHRSPHGPDVQVGRDAVPGRGDITGSGTPHATTAATGQEVVWKVLAEAITQECVLRFDPATGWGHWATAVPGRVPVFLGFVRIDPQLRAIPDLAGHTLMLCRTATDDGFCVTAEDRQPPQWNSWLVLRTETCDGWREARLASGLRTALAGW